MLKRILAGIFSCALLLQMSTLQAQSVNQLFHAAGDPVEGNPRGKITVVEFYDYQCGYCVKMAPTLNATLKANPNVRMVYKVLPIRGPMSEYAARAALAANRHGKFPALNQRLFSMAPYLSEKGILDAAKKLGLNPKTLAKTMQSEKITNQIRNNYRLAQALNLSGTPVFFVGRTNATHPNQVEMLYGALSQSELQEAIHKAG